VKITIEPTPQIITIEGHECRRWLGITDQGIRCDVFVRRLCVGRDQDCEAFERELREMPQPTAPAIDLRLLI